MPEFQPGESKTALVPMTNPTTKAFDYQGVLYMGTDLAVMSEIPFHLEAGESKDINMPVTMPTEAGVYPVNIGVFSNGQFIEPVYHAEDVVIKPEEVRSVRAYYKGLASMFPAGRNNGVTYDSEREVDPNYFGVTTEWSLASTFIIPADATITQIEFDMLYTYGYNRFDYRWTDQKSGEAEVIIAERYVEPPPNAYHHYTIPIGVVPWSFSNVSCFTEPSGVGMWYQVNYSATITNIGDREATKTVTLWRKQDVPILGIVGDWYIVEQIEVTLAPGESYSYNNKNLISYDTTSESYLADSDGYESAHCYTPAVPS